MESHFPHNCRVVRQILTRRHKVISKSAFCYRHDGPNVRQMLNRTCPRQLLRWPEEHVQGMPQGRNAIEAQG